MGSGSASRTCGTADHGSCCRRIVSRCVGPKQPKLRWRCWHLFYPKLARLGAPQICIASLLRAESADQAVSRLGKIQQRLRRTWLQLRKSVNANHTAAWLRFMCARLSFSLVCVWAIREEGTDTVPQLLKRSTSVSWCIHLRNRSFNSLLESGRLVLHRPVVLP